MIFYFLFCFMNFLFFIFAFILFAICLQNRQVMVASLVTVVGLAGESPRAPIAEAPATFGER